LDEGNTNNRNWNEPICNDIASQLQWAQKAESRLAEGRARTLDALIKAIAQALAKFASQECANYIANVGYLPVS
jgi:hypothetical protein